MDICHQRGQGSPAWCPWACSYSTISIISVFRWFWSAISNNI